MVANARAARPGIKLAAPAVMMFADKWWIDVSPPYPSKLEVSEAER